MTAQELEKNLKAFCAAIRSKLEWFVKILDDPGLGLKWAGEANLLVDTDKDGAQHRHTLSTLQ